MKNRKFYLKRAFVYLLILFYIMILKEDKVNLPIMGILLLALSADSMIIYRNRTNLFVLLAFLAITNLCIVYGCFWFYEENTYTWQVSISASNSAVLTAKSLSVFYISMLIALILSYRPSNTIYSSKIIVRSQLSFGYGVFGLVYLFMYYVLIFCFNRTIDEYTSGSSALYEYIIVIFIAVWINMPNKKICRILMLVYASLYILQGLVFGDRSSALPLILVLYILLSKNIIPLRFISLAILGILGANLIGIYRKTFLFSSDILSEAASRIFYVDSISYSFYSGVQIINASNRISLNKLEHFLGWFQSLFLGNSGTYDLARLVMQNGDFHNTGGGMTSVYFYFWGGLLGVIIGGCIIGIILGKIFSKNDSVYPLLQIIILAFTLRWYSYFPNVFFRTCIVVPVLLYTVMNLFVLKKKIQIKHY